jgi:hypothetical protein
VDAIAALAKSAEAASARLPSEEDAKNIDIWGESLTGLSQLCEGTTSFAEFIERTRRWLQTGTEVGDLAAFRLVETGTFGSSTLAWTMAALDQADLQLLQQRLRLADIPASGCAGDYLATLWAASANYGDNMISSWVNQSVPLAIGEQLVEIYSTDDGFRLCDSMLYAILCHVEPMQNGDHQAILQARSKEFAMKGITFGHLVSHGNQSAEPTTALQSYLCGAIVDLSESQAGDIAKLVVQTAKPQPAAKPTKKEPKQAVSAELNNLSTMEMVQVLRQKILHSIQRLHACPFHEEYIAAAQNGEGCALLDEVGQETKNMMENLIHANKSAQSVRYRVSIVGKKNSLTQSKSTMYVHYHFWC